ncbi:hypothetical protein B0H19DRAFT_1368418 [Mycena capillaripes]|nr:hypothetical protein B0H19DRAFT_1368418 [Mycena capillaripes]
MHLQLFRDGSLVLQAQNTQFRVHWGVLAQQSSFFFDMQGLPQPPEQPSIDGCPVIELSDDVADVEHLLKAAYDPTFLLQMALPLPVIAALIRLGRKYDFSNLWESAVERLTFENPTTLAGYEALIIPGKSYNTTRIVHYPGILLDIITLARENDILSVLPSAYYRALMYHTLAQLLDGVPRGDGTTASLAPVDQRRCILSRDELAKARFEPGYSLGWLKKWDYDSDCVDPPKCMQARFSQLYSYLKCNPLWILHRNPVEQKLFCPACNRHAAELTFIGRKKLWEDFPRFFDVPVWSDLKNNL